MTRLMQSLFSRLMDAVGDDGADASGGADRGDTHDNPLDKIDTPAAETTAPAAAEPAPRDPDTGKFIPKARFDDAIEKERGARDTAERRVQELEAQLGQMTKGVDVAKAEEAIVALEAQYGQLMLDGNQEKAAQVMKDIRLKERQIALSEAQQMSQQSRAVATEEIRVDMAVERLEATYDVLNPGHETYNQDVVDLVLAKQGQLITVERMSPSAALTKAAADVMKLLNPAGSTAPTKAGLGAAQAPDRKAAQVAKNLATASAQPGSLRDVGLDSDAAGMKGKYIDMNGISQEDFAALPVSTLARMRGDAL